MINLTALDIVHDGYEHLRKTNRHFRNCSERLVPGEGFGDIRFMVIGEAPGAQEDMLLRPFVGPAGNILRTLCRTAMPFSNCRGGVPHRIWLTNVVKHRPAGNATPSQQAITACRPLLDKEWIAVGCPRIIVPVGATAVQALWGQPVAISRLAGNHFRIATRIGTVVDVWPMFHPSHGLRNPSVQPTIEEHWNAFGEWLQHEPAT